MRMSDSQAHHLLTLEGYLLQGCLKTGLNALQQGHVGNKGAYYTAFFQLSIGIERLLKVILLIDHIARNDLAMPSSKMLRNYSHDLDKLFNAVKLLPDPSPNPLGTIKPDSVAAKLISFLAKFAKNTRYHNIDVLVGASTATDPLAEWHGIVQTIFVEDIPQASKKAVLPQLAISALLMQDHVFVAGRNLDGSKMDIFDSVLGAGVEHLAGRYATRHILQIIAHLRTVLDSAVMRAHEVERKLGRRETEVPYMEEFLICFPHDRRQMLRKRTYGWM